MLNSEGSESKYNVSITLDGTTGVKGDSNGCPCHAEVKIRAITIGVGVTNVVVLQGRIRNLDLWVNLLTLTGEESNTVDVSSYDFVRYDCTVVSGTGYVVAAGFFFTGDLYTSSINTKIPALGQATMALSSPVVLASNHTNIPIELGDSSTIDAFGRLRVSNPTNVFDAQFTYDLNPLLFEPITNGSGASIAHDTTNRNALMTFSSTPTGGKAYLQTFQHFRYQPGKSSRILITFNFLSQVSNCLKFAGYSDGVNGLEFQNNGTTNQFVIYSGTTNGNQTATQANWNLDKLDGTGKSGITLDITKGQILVIDFQALYTGRVRFGFDLNGVIYYAHEFMHANVITHTFIQTANLPIRVGMTCTGTVSTTMKYHCSSVQSEGGQETTSGYEFTYAANTTAASGERTHLMSIRPKALFNGIQNRIPIRTLEMDLLVTGNNPVLCELVIGQAISGTTTFSDVNSTYSVMEVNTLGTLSGSPAIVVDSIFAGASNQSKGSSTMSMTHRYPITLDAAGVARINGTVSLLVTGLGGASACYGSLKWVGVR